MKFSFQDPEIARAIFLESQAEGKLELIASENIVSTA